jgi:hypothetical protein
MYLRAELNSQWPITPSTNTSNTGNKIQDKTNKKQQKKQITKKNVSV